MIQVEVPDEMATCKLPVGVDRRLCALLEKQDSGIALSADEKQEAEELVNLAEMLSLIRLRSNRPG